MNNVPGIYYNTQLDVLFFVLPDGTVELGDSINGEWAASVMPWQWIEPGPGDEYLGEL